MRNAKTVLIALLAVAASTNGALAQLTIPWYTIDGGGGTSTGGNFTLSGTIGQPDAGVLSGGNFILSGGFWAGAVAVNNCFVDFNADGFLNQEDLGGFLTAFLAEPPLAGPSGTNFAPCPGEPAPYDTAGYAADYNRDCSFNQEDLGGYITEYFFETENPTNCIPG